MATETASITANEPAWTKSSTDRAESYYWFENIDDKITPEVRNLLEAYSRIPADQVRDHIYAIREKAWAIRAYPCTGMGVWLNPILPYNPSYSRVVQRIKDGASFIDIGCFMGQDVRRLVTDGAPQDNLYAADVVDHWDLGYELFRDRDRFSVRNLHGDILEPGADLKALEGKMDIISITNVLHLFDWPDQLRAAETLCKLSRPGTSIIGFQCGTLGANRIDTGKLFKDGEKRVFWQTTETWKQLWDQAGQNTGTTWDCQANLLDWEYIDWKRSEANILHNDLRLLQFEITRKA